MKLSMVEHAYQPYGAVWDLFWGDVFDDEILLEGPAGTGKSRGALEYVYKCCEEYPGIRVLLARATRKSMTESVLVTWEDIVLPPGHPCRTGKATRANRPAYTFPNGSHVVVAGLDNPDKIMSAEFDLAVVFEATELTSPESWERILTRLRNHRIRDHRYPSGFMERAIADCNPKHAGHWLNRRANMPNKEPLYDKQMQMRRLLSRHEDNPSVTAGYLRKLRSLTGHRYERLYLGRWVSAEGLVYPQWDPHKHVMTGEWVHEGEGRGYVKVLRDWDVSGKVEYELVPIEWTCAGMDFGHTAPSVVQVYGVDGRKRLWCLAELYFTKRKRQWWADRIVEMANEYGLSTMWCDPEDAEAIEVLNDRMGRWGGHTNDRRFARKAINSLAVGIPQMQECLEPTRGGGPGMFFLRDRFPLGKDEERIKDNLPTCLEEEIEELVWKELAEGVRSREKPDDSCEDHACDVARYVCAGVWRKNLASDRPRMRYGKETFGEVLGYDEERVRRLMLDLENGDA